MSSVTRTVIFALSTLIHSSLCMLIGTVIQDTQTEASYADGSVSRLIFPSECFQSPDCQLLVLYFYPGDFTSICATEALAFDDKFSEFLELGATIVGCSINGPYTHNAWKNRPKTAGGLGTQLKHPIIADVNGELCRAFDVLIPKRHVATRGLFILDRTGTVLFESRHDTKTARNVSEIVEIVRDIERLNRNSNDKRNRVDSI